MAKKFFALIALGFIWNLTATFHANASSFQYPCYPGHKVMDSLGNAGFLLEREGKLPQFEGAPAYEFVHPDTGDWIIYFRSPEDNSYLCFMGMGGKWAPGVGA